MAELRRVDFLGQSHAALPVEVVERAALLGRFEPSYFATAQRVTFGLVMVVQAGRGLHTVDFEPVELGPGRLVLIHPGQVHQWHPGSSVDAWAVLIGPTAAVSDRWLLSDAPYRDLDDGSMATAVSIVESLVREQERFDASDASVRLMTGLAEALVALFERAGPVEHRAPLPEAYRAFRASVERDFATVRTVRGHVIGLGFSERTVDRACRQATGLSAKAVLDERVALEAKRLLANTDRPAASIAAELGFSEATNFHKFFTRLVGETPGGFRAELRSAGYRAETVVHF